MGILNVTPDSFADGGRYLDPSAALDAALRMQEDGADIIDVGGESTRPGADHIDADEELRRVRPVIERLTRALTIPLSIDTSKAAVAEVALREGAAIVNDVSALRYDAALADVAARYGAALVLMHSRGSSRDMYREAVYASVADEIRGELEASMSAAIRAGVRREAIVLDPGLGFAKRAEHSLAALAALPALAALGRPLLVGPSRKSFLKAAVGERSPEERDTASAAACAIAALLGAHVVRMHAVQLAVESVRVADAVRRF